MAVARGDEPADLVLSGGHVFSVFTKEWLDVDVAIHDGFHDLAMIALAHMKNAAGVGRRYHMFIEQITQGGCDKSQDGIAA